MKYEYNHKTLEFKPVKSKNWIYFLLGMIIFSFISAGITYKTTIEYIPVIIKYEEKPFSEKDLIKEMDNLHIKFKDVVLAQSIIEGASITGKRWQNPLFLNGNNFLGLKKAYARPSTAIDWGKDEYCIYNSWRDCLIDYSLYQAAYLRKIKTKEEYFQYIDETYSTSSNYSKLLKSVKLD